jgi:hypothetical protein
MRNKNPTIVVAAYRRTAPLERLMASISNAIYNNGSVDLIISIDNYNNTNNDVVNFAREYNWPYGHKEVIYHDKNLGIFNHFNFCGNLTKELGTIIFLEDDLFASKYFYSYALQALDAFSGDENIAGISLFNYNRIEQWTNPYPFYAMDDGADNYFLQQASWGQVWTERMWEGYMNWLQDPATLKKAGNYSTLPKVMRGWPNTSWKKHYIAYMIEQGKYYVFPRVSLCSNFDDPGTNRKRNTVYYQSPILVGNKSFSFNQLHDSLSIYDAYFEILPATLKKLNPNLADYEFEVNLYGNKSEHLLNNKTVLSKISGKENIFEYGLKMKPHELNVIFDVQGKGVYLANGLTKHGYDPTTEINNFSYFYRDLNYHETLGYLKHKLKRKLKDLGFFSLL